MRASPGAAFAAPAVPAPLRGGTASRSGHVHHLAGLVESCASAGTQITATAKARAAMVVDAVRQPDPLDARHAATVPASREPELPVTAWGARSRSSGSAHM